MLHYARAYGSIYHPNKIDVAWKYPIQYKAFREKRYEYLKKYYESSFSF